MITVDEEALRILMIQKGIKTISELSAKSGISRPTLMKYINGDSPLSSSFIKLCSFLETDPESLTKLVEFKEECNNGDKSSN